VGMGKATRLPLMEAASATGIQDIESHATICTTICRLQVTETYSCSCTRRGRARQGGDNSWLFCSIREVGVRGIAARNKRPVVNSRVVVCVINNKCW